MKKPQANSYQDKVLKYLKTGHSLDLPKALALFGICRLSSAVLELRKKGFDVRTTEIKGPEGNKFSFYTLPKKIDKDTRIGTRVRVTKAASDSYVGKVGTLTSIDDPYREDGYCLNVTIDDCGMELGFNHVELEPEYVRAK